MLSNIPISSPVSVQPIKTAATILTDDPLTVVFVDLTVDSAPALLTQTRVRVDVILTGRSVHTRGRVALVDVHLARLALETWIHRMVEILWINSLIAIIDLKLHSLKIILFKIQNIS